MDVSVREVSNRNWLGLAGLVVGLLAFAALMNGDVSFFRAIYGVLTGWAFLGVAYLLWDRLSTNRMPLLIALVGFTWFIGAFFNTNVPVIVALSLWFGDLFRVVLSQVALSHPDGRLRSGAATAVVGIGYLFILVVGLIRTMSDIPYEYFSCECPRNALGVIHSESFFDTIDLTYGIIGAALELVVIGLLLRLYRSSERGRADRPYLFTAASLALLLVVDVLTEFVEFDIIVLDWLYLPVHAALIGAAWSFLVALRPQSVPQHT